MIDAASSGSLQAPCWKAWFMCIGRCCDSCVTEVAGTSLKGSGPCYWIACQAMSNGAATSLNMQRVRCNPQSYEYSRTG